MSAATSITDLGPKHRDGHRYPTITSHGVEYRVKVVTQDAGRYTYVSIAGGDFPVYREVGLLVKRGVGVYEFKPRNQDGTLSGGYTDRGTLAHFVSSLVHHFVGAAEHAKREAEKSPEQRAEEAAQREAAGNAVRNQVIAREAHDLLATLERFVPTSTVHYAVEDARRALEVLIREANKASIKTVAAPKN